MIAAAAVKLPVPGLHAQVHSHRRAVIQLHSVRFIDKHSYGAAGVVNGSRVPEFCIMSAGSQMPAQQAVLGSLRIIQQTNTLAGNCSQQYADDGLFRNCMTACWHHCRSQCSWSAVGYGSCCPEDQGHERHVKLVEV